MRVLMMSGNYRLAGSLIVIENLAEQLGKKGLEVTIGALHFKRIPPKGHYNVKKINVNNISKLATFLNSFDILHSHHPLMNYLAFLSRKPFIYHFHGAPNIGKGMLYRFNTFISIKIMKRAFDKVISVSESGAKELEKYFGLNDVSVIYNGVDTNRFRPDLSEKFRSGRPQFIFVGNLYIHKRVEELVYAFKKFLKFYPKAHLQIVGYGTMFTRINDIITHLNLKKNITLVGRVPDYELPYYYASSDVYVSASQYEVCPVPLLEAMASGKPIVASSIPPHVELLSKSKAGMTYDRGDLGDLSKKMIETYEGREWYKSNALRFAKEHDWSVVAEHVIRIYTLAKRSGL